jgi:hypothetical protein
MTKNALGYISMATPKPGELPIRIETSQKMVTFRALSAGYHLLDVVVGMGDDEAAIETLLQRAVSERVDTIFAASGKLALRNPHTRKMLEDRCRALGIQLEG